MKTLIRTCSALALFAPVILGCAENSSENQDVEREREPRNLIFILVDTLRADHLSAYGYDRDSTPNLDRFFAESTLFENARSNASCTFPSVNSMMTSRHPMEFVSRGALGSKENGAVAGREEVEFYWQSANRPAKFGIPDDVPSLPEILQEAGYYTAAVSASPIVRDEPSEEATNRWGGYGRGYDVFLEDCLNQSAECVNQAARDVLDNRPAGQPFFLYLHYMEPHGPYQPPEDFDRKYAVEERDVAHVNQGNPYPFKDLLKTANEGAADIDPEDLAHLVDLYDDEIAYLDSALARLFSDLGARGLMEESVLVFASDHGESFVEHGSLTHCETVFDPEVRVPLVIRIPGREGSRIATPAQNLDLVPTLLHALAVERPDLELEGENLLALAEAELAGSPESRYVFSAQRAYRAVHDRDYKLVVDLLTGETEIIALRSTTEVSEPDPVPRTDVQRLESALEEFLIRVEGGVGSEESLDSSRRIEEELRALGYLED